MHFYNKNHLQCIFIIKIICNDYSKSYLQCIFIVRILSWQLEKYERTHKWHTPIDPFKWTSKGRTTSKKPTYNSTVLVQDVALKTYREWWTIEKGGGRGLGRSVLVAWQDNDDSKDHFIHLQWIFRVNIVSNVFLYIHFFLCLFQWYINLWGLLNANAMLLEE